MKNYVEKRLLKIFLTEDEVLDTDQTISARSIALFIFTVRWALRIVWSTTTRTRVTAATAVIFSVKCFNQLKLYNLSGSIL